MSNQSGEMMLLSESSDSIGSPLDNFPRNNDLINQSKNSSFPLTLSWRQKYSMELLFKLQFLQMNTDPNLLFPTSSSDTKDVSGSEPSTSLDNPFFLFASRTLTEMLLVIENSQIEEDINFEFYNKHFPPGGFVTKVKSIPIKNDKNSNKSNNSNTLSKEIIERQHITTKKSLTGFIISQNKKLQKKGKFQNSTNGCEYCGKKYPLQKGYHTCRVCLVTLCRKCTKNLNFCDFYTKNENQSKYLNNVTFSVPVCSRCEKGVTHSHYPIIRNCLDYSKKLNESIALLIDNYIDLKLFLAEKMDSYIKKQWVDQKNWLLETKKHLSAESWLYLQWNPVKTMLFYFSEFLLIEQHIVCVIFGLAYVLKDDVTRELIQRMKDFGEIIPLHKTYFHKDMLGIKQNFKSIRKELGLSYEQSNSTIYEPILAESISKEWILKYLPGKFIEVVVSATEEMIDNYSHLSSDYVKNLSKRLTNLMLSYCVKQKHKSNYNFIKLEKVDSDDYLCDLL